MPPFANRGLNNTPEDLMRQCGKRLSATTR